MAGAARELVRAAMVVDAAGTMARPGVVLREGTHIVAAGAPPGVGAPAPGVRVIDRPDAVVMPALVNAHAHLDLTHVGPQPCRGDIGDWLEMVRARRADHDAAIAASVEQGVALSREGGTALVGDIGGSGSRVSLRTLRRCGLAGVSFLEVFGRGPGEAAAIDALRRAVEDEPAVDRGVGLGLQPHAPYSCSAAVYRAAASFGRPLATHLAETPEEVRFLHHGDGPLAELLARLGVPEVPPAGRHPVEEVLDAVGDAALLAVHLNCIDPGHLALLAQHAVTVAYCPRAAAYFGHPRPGQAPHSWRRMLEAGIPVALGTDSIICLDTPDRISVLDEMRFLRRRDGADPRRLLEMATTIGARALGFDPALFTLDPGPTAGVLAVPVPPGHADPLAAALEGDAAPRWIVGPVPGGGALAPRPPREAAAR